MKDLAGFTKVLNWIAHQVPSIYHPTGRPGLAALVNLISSACSLKAGAAEHQTYDLSVDQFCQALGDIFQLSIPAMMADKDESLGQIPKWLAPSILPTAWTMNVEGAYAAYEEVKKKHPEAAWPKPYARSHESQSEGLASDGSEGRYETRMTEGDEAAFRSNDEASTHIGDEASTGSSEYAITDDDDSGPAHLDLLNAFDGIGTRSLFMTKQGYMGIGPN
jgi:hypothetical protein